MYIYTVNIKGNTNLLYSSLLIFHIICGSISLLAGYGAIWVKRGGSRHKQLGKIYVIGMSIVAATAYIMSALKPNAFLFGIALFTTYFIYTGWSMVGGRWKRYEIFDRFAAFTFLVTALICLIILAYIKFKPVEFNNTLFITALAFSSIAIFISLQDILGFNKTRATVTERIINHFSKMCAGLIATTTAMMVTVFNYIPTIPPIIAWIGPTVIITPLIIYWANQKRANAP